jgi:hypothetical protein
VRDLEVKIHQLPFIEEKDNEGEEKKQLAEISPNKSPSRIADKSTEATSIVKSP